MGAGGKGGWDYTGNLREDLMDEKTKQRFKSSERMTRFLMWCICAFVVSIAIVIAVAFVKLYKYQNSEEYQRDKAQREELYNEKDNKSNGFGKILPFLFFLGAAL